MIERIFIFIVNLIAKTWRITLEGEKPESNSFIGFWHGGMLPVWYYFRNQKPIAIVSQSRDGQLLAKILEKWGLKTIRGSSSKGGKEVLDLMTKEVENNIVLLTPDGPRGPKHKMKAGIILASQRSMKPMYFCGVNIISKYVFKKSWDKFEFPKPFARITLSLSDKILIDKELNKDEINILLNTLSSKFAYIYNDKNDGEVSL